MSEIQHPVVTAGHPETKTLLGLYPPMLTNEELKRYATLTGPSALPQEWLIEIARRFLKTH